MPIRSRISASGTLPGLPTGFLRRLAGSIIVCAPRLLFQHRPAERHPPSVRQQCRPDAGLNNLALRLTTIPASARWLVPLRHARRDPDRRAFDFLPFRNPSSSLFEFLFGAETASTQPGQFLTRRDPGDPLHLAVRASFPYMSAPRRRHQRFISTVNRRPRQRCLPVFRTPTTNPLNPQSPSCRRRPISPGGVATRPYAYRPARVICRWLSPRPAAPTTLTRRVLPRPGFPAGRP